MRSLSVPPNARLQVNRIRFPRTNEWVLTLFLLNVVAAAHHCIDSIAFFDGYPEPPWLKPS